VIKKSLQTTLEHLLKLNALLWIQVGGMSVSISLGVLILGTYHTGDSLWKLIFIFLGELFLIIFSITSFSVYLSNSATIRAEKLGLRKTLGTSGWSLFLETSAQTTLLMLLSILLSIVLVDVSLFWIGLNFETLLHSYGVVHYGLLLLIIFIVSEGVLFVILGVALAPNVQSKFDETTLRAKAWFIRLTKVLIQLSVLFLVLAGILMVPLFYSSTVLSRVALLYLVFYLLLISWWVVNKKTSSPN